MRHGWGYTGSNRSFYRQVRRLMKTVVALTLLLVVPSVLRAQPESVATTPRRGVLLEHLTWLEAEPLLTDSTIIVLPLGAAAKEHGPHLRLNNDWIMAEYLKERVLDEADVVVAPTINYHFYPSFLEYPGSTSLRLTTAQDLIVDIVRTLAAYGPRRFYVLNTGVSTIRPLEASAAVMARQGIRLAFTDILEVAGPVEKEVAEQEGGTHADEIETSMMLYIAPETVDMAKAVKDYDPRPVRSLTRDPQGAGKYSPTGVYGDATLATREKGERVVEATVAGILADIEALRQAPLPTLQTYDAVLSRYVGTYTLAPEETVTITEQEDRLFYQRSDGRRYAMTAESAISFHIGELARLTFLPDVQGAVRGFYMRWMGQEVLATKHP